MMIATTPYSESEHMQIVLGNTRVSPTGVSHPVRSSQCLLRRRTARAAFAERFSGEWEGALATFDAEGKVEELPGSIVPTQYKEWEVQVHMP